MNATAKQLAKLRADYPAAMRTIQRLKQDAGAAARFRGHDMGQWYDVSEQQGRIISSASCRTCGRIIALDTRPAPNGIDIAGEAVAVGCN